MITKPCKLQDPVRVRELVEEYFQELNEKEEVRELKSGDKRVYKTPPSVLGLCLKLGISRESFYNYTSGEVENCNTEIVDTLIYAKERISQELIEGVAKGYWTEKIVLHLLSRYGVIGEDTDTTVKVVIQGSPDWSK